MKKVDYMISLKTLLKKENFKINDLVRALNTSDIDEMINRLFHFFNNNIDNISKVENLDYIENGIKSIPYIVENFPNINYKKLKREYKKLYEKIVRMQIENIDKYQNPVSTLKKLKKILSAIESIDDKKDLRYFEFLKFIVCDIKNFDYLVETLKRFPDMINSKDKNDKTILSTIVKDYLENITSAEFSREQLLYYNSVISLITGQSQFIYKTKEKRQCLQEIRKSISSLYYQDKNYKTKKALIEDLGKLLENNKGNNLGISQLIHAYQIKTVFPDDVQDEMESIMNLSKKSQSKRVRIKDYIITIDAKKASEIDDALSIYKKKNGNYLLGVHIASVLGYIPYSSPIIKEAISRGRSIYLPGRQKMISGLDCYNLIPIFPYQFSSNRASLVENKPRLTNSYFFEIDSNGEIIDSKFLKTSISSNKKCNYHEINNVIKNGSENKRFEQTVRLLDELTYKLEEKDKAKSIYIDIKNLKVDPSNIRVSENSRAEKIVGQIMKLTNSKIADYFAHSSEGYPFLYRVHMSDNKNISKLESQMKQLMTTNNREEFNNLYNALVSSCPNAYYDLSGSHEGLFLKHYCHGTSPLRRSADIIVEHALDVCYFKNPSDKELTILEKDIKENKDTINDKNNNIECFMNHYAKNKQKVKRK